jgi:hypothetical protein
MFSNSFLLLAIVPLALAVPAPSPVAIRAPPHPMITARATLADRRSVRHLEERDVFDSVKGLESYLTSVIGTFPSYVASGVPNFFQGFPTGTAVQSSLGINNDDLDAIPTQVLNIP